MFNHPLLTFAGSDWLPSQQEIENRAHAGENQRGERNKTTQKFLLTGEEMVLQAKSCGNFLGCKRVSGFWNRNRAHIPGAQLAIP